MLRAKKWMGKVFFEKKIPQSDEEPSGSGSESSKPGKVGVTFQAWSLIPDPGPSLRCALVKARAEVIMRGKVLAAVKPDEDGNYPAPMSDTLMQPCMEESERFPGLYEKIDRE